MYTTDIIFCCVSYEFKYCVNVIENINQILLVGSYKFTIFLVSYYKWRLEESIFKSRDSQKF